jgi:hypothetical protein
MYHVPLFEHTRYYNNIALGVPGLLAMPKRKKKRDSQNREKLQEKRVSTDLLLRPFPLKSPKADPGVTCPLLLQNNLATYRTNFEQSKQQLTTDRLTCITFALGGKKKMFTQEKTRET